MLTAVTPGFAARPPPNGQTCLAARSPVVSCLRGAASLLEPVEEGRGFFRQRAAWPSWCGGWRWMSRSRAAGSGDPGPGIRGPGEDIRACRRHGHSALLAFRRSQTSATAPRIIAPMVSGSGRTSSLVTVSFAAAVTFRWRWGRSAVRVSWVSCHNARNAARCGSAPSSAARTERARGPHGVLGDRFGGRDACQGPAGTRVPLQQPDLVEEPGDVSWLAAHSAALQFLVAIAMPYRSAFSSPRAEGDTWFSSSRRAILVSRSAASGREVRPETNQRPEGMDVQLREPYVAVNPVGQVAGEPPAVPAAQCC